MIIAGIDPGVNGGISLYDGKKLAFIKMPETFQAMCVSLKNTDEVYIEEVHAIFGSSAGSTFTFGRMFQMCIDACDCSNKKYTLVQPKTWQKKLLIDSDIVYKKTTPKKIKDTKATALNCANRIFKVDDLYWRNSVRQKKAQDGLYDSALIAYYGFSIAI